MKNESDFCGCFCDPCAVAQPELTKKEPRIDAGFKSAVLYDGVYVEEEGVWFEEQGAKCFLQRTERNSVATKGHLHDALEIILIEKGRFTAYINDRKYEVLGGDLLFFRPQDVHRIYSADTDENLYYVMKIHPSLVFDLADKKNGAAYMLRFALAGVTAKHVWLREELSESSVASCIRRLADECLHKRPYFDIAVRELAAAVILFLLRSDGGGEERPIAEAVERNAAEQIYRSITFMNSHYREGITAYDAARHVGMSYSHFSRSFGAITGQSFKEYLNTVRQRKAEELLLTTDKSIAEVSVECGYSNVSYFIMSFRHRHGMTPGEYKNKMKGKCSEQE